ncbi:MAG: EamA family transporter [Clostridia bacterium]|nr:EamA family transporter [Clostridia bacterium]
MWVYYVSIILAIISNVFYYFIQKSIPHNANPLLSLAVTYLTAMITCLVVLPFYPNNEGMLDSFKRLNWTSVFLGVAIVGLEMGFLLAFRAGWNISTAGVLANVIVAMILIPVGITVFKEHLKPVNILGIILCIVGLVLVSRK